MRVVYYEIAETPSTNLVAKQLISFFDPYALTVVTTRSQTAGLGKFGRSWHSGEQDVTLSLCFRITKIDVDGALLFQLGTEVVLRMVQELGITSARVKWPNDVLAEGEKLCGILSETVQLQDHLGIIIGIGVNCNSTKAELKDVGQPATSLTELLGESVPVEKIQERLVHHAVQVIHYRLGQLLMIKPNLR